MDRSLYGRRLDPRKAFRLCGTSCVPAGVRVSTMMATSYWKLLDDPALDWPADLTDRVRISALSLDGAGRRSLASSAVVAGAADVRNLSFKS